MSRAICDYEGSTYQTDFWERGGREYEDRAEAIALKRLLPASGKLLLEVGAGAGRNTPRYAGFEHVVLLDYSRTQLEHAQTRLGRSERYTYVAADVYRLPFVPGLFDAATMIRVIHHLADAPAALAQIRAALRPGAAFVLEFANKRNLKAIARWLLRRQSWSPFNPEPVEFVALNFDFHPAIMRRWVQEAGYRIQDSLAVSYFRFGLLKRLVPLNWLVGLDALLQPTGRWLQLSPSLFVRAGASGASPVAPPGKFFRCPECSCDDLKDNGDHLLCSECGRRWGTANGIFDFRQPLANTSRWV